MTIQCEECYDSPTTRDTYHRGGDPSATTHLRVRGTTQWLEAHDTAVSWILANRVRFGDLPIKALTVAPIEGTDCWDVRIEYGFKSSVSDTVLDYRFQTNGNKARVTSTLQTRSSVSAVAGLPAYTFGGAIGVDSNGNVAGTEIKTPAFSWSQTQAFSASTVTAAFRRRLADYTAKVNSEPFMGFEPGEVLFEGVTDGRLCHEADPNTGQLGFFYRLTFSFSAMPNKENIQIGDAVVSKRGWDYLWILWETTVSRGVVTKYPRNVSVEQVYEERDLNDLGLVQL